MKRPTPKSRAIDKLVFAAAQAATNAPVHPTLTRSDVVSIVRAQLREIPAVDDARYITNQNHADIAQPQSFSTPQTSQGFAGSLSKTEAPPAPAPDTTVVLLDRLGASSVDLRGRVAALLSEAGSGSGNPAAGGVSCQGEAQSDGINDRLQRALHNIYDANEYLSKLSTYIGVKV